MDPSASMVGRRDKDGLITEEDKDVETNKLALVSRGNIDPKK